MKTKFLSTVYFIPLLVGLFALSSMFLYGQKYGDDDEGEIYFDNIIMEQFGWIGENFTYDFNAVSKSESEIRYELIKQVYEENYPEGMTIDATTGVVNWVPENNGDYVVMVRAYLVDDPEEEATSGFLLMVRDSINVNPCAKITGTVKDAKTGDPLENMIVIAISHARDMYNIIKFQSITDNNGNYSIDVAQGKYMLYATSQFGERHLFYNNVDDVAAADTVRLDCEQTFVANFDMPEAKPDTGKIDPEIMFVTWPENNQVKVGDNFVYDAEAKAIDDKKVVYQLLDGPEGAGIDAETGIVTWIASMKGIYHFSIEAHIEENIEQSAVQEWDIFVIDSVPVYPCAYIDGKVTDQNGDPVMYAFVTAISTDEARYYSHMENSYFAAETDHNGNYSLNVAEGGYIVFVEGAGFKEVIYGNNGLMDTVSVKCDDTREVNFQVNKFYPDKYYHVAGRITDANTGTPIMGTVEFYPEPGIMDSLFVYGYDKQLTIATDANGFYDIELPGIMKYVVFAMADQLGYIPQFYLNATDFSEATQIEVKEDMTGIDFALKPVYNYHNGFSGTVKDSEGNPVAAYVAAFLTSKPDNPIDQVVYGTVTDTTINGDYTISNLTPGKYVVMAAPMADGIAPGFYVENDLATLDYESATILEIKENETLPNKIVITLPKAEGIGGISQLKGKIEAQSEINTKDGDVILGTSPVAGALISASDNNNKVVDYCYSDSNGDYSLAKIGVGQYKIQVSKVGFDTYETSLDFNLKEKNRLQKDIVLTPKTATSVDDPVAGISSAKVFPNPASAAAMLEFPGNGEKVNVSIVNLLGNEVLSLSVNTSAEKQSVKLNTGNLATGAYIVKISGKDIRLNTILNIIR